MRALKLGIILVLLFVLTAGQWGEVGNSKWGQVETASSGDIEFPLTSDDNLATHWRAWGDPITDYVDKDGDGRISELFDLSGEGNDWIQDTGNNQPLWSEEAGDLIGGHEVIKFTTDEYATCNAVGALLTGKNTLFTVFLVVRKDDNSASHAFFSLSNSATTNTFHRLMTVAAGPEYRIDRRGDNQPVSGTGGQGGTPDTSPHYLVHTFIGTSTTGRGSLWVDGILEIDDVNMYVNVFTSDRCAVGMTNAAYFNYLEGDIVEFALCTKALSADRRQAVEVYFASEYGI